MLKIGTSKVGSVVDCPRCKKCLVVPPQSAPQAEEAYRSLKNQRAHPPTSPAGSTAASIPSWEALEEEIDDANMPLWMEETWTPPSADSQDFYPAPVANPVLTEEMAIHVLKKRHNLTIMLLSVSLVVAFFLGITFGILISGFYVQPSRPGQHANAPIGGNEVAGTLYFINKDGDRRGDVESAVICLPQDKQPSTLFSCQGLRPGDTEKSDTVQMLHELGGMYARVDNNGTFTLPYQTGVRYLVILISANQKPTGGEMKPSVAQELRRYFRDPELFGEFCVHIDEHEWGTPTLRHTFEFSD